MIETYKLEYCNSMMLRGLCRDEKHSEHEWQGHMCLAKVYAPVPMPEPKLTIKVRFAYRADNAILEARAKLHQVFRKLDDRLFRLSIPLSEIISDYEECTDNICGDDHERTLRDSWLT